MAILSGHDIGTTFSDFWASGDNRPIHLKEEDAIFKALSSMVSRVADSRVDILTDNMAVIHSMPIHVLQYVKRVQKLVCTHGSSDTYAHKRTVNLMHA